MQAEHGNCLGKKCLHYEKCFWQAAKRRMAGGTLLVVDFAAHEREELRERDAHIRLGFEDEVMAGWFNAADLEVDQVRHLAGGELTVTLWRGIKRAVRQRRAA